MAKKKNLIWIVPILGLAIAIYALMVLINDPFIYDVTESNDNITPQNPSTKPKPKPLIKKAKQDWQKRRQAKRVENKPKYKIIECKMLNDALILSVSTFEPLYKFSQKQLREIASSLVAKNSNEYMVRVFFYNPGEKAGKEGARCRFEWTEQQGLKLSYNLIKR